ncbi:MAG: c-type cytochrome [Chthoniobacter sp.]|nr:c-type cytochrome [Chthoniobacter sp.]
MNIPNILRPILFALALSPLVHAAPLRVLIASGDPALVKDSAAALQKAGAVVITAAVPDAAALEKADAVLLQSTKFEALPAAAQAALTAFAQRGGGIVAVGAAVAAGDVAWGKATLGGAWDAETSQRFSSRMMLYVRTDAHSIVREASSFDVDDDTLYDLALADNVFVLGSAFTPKVTKGRAPAGGKVDKAKDSAGKERAAIYDIQPQAWAFEGAKHRAAVFLQSAPATLQHASMRAFIFRALAWTARRENADELCNKADLADLRYPAGGPRRAADAIKQFEMQPGFKATVVAAEPLVTKPIAIQWDARGRLWVAETPEYPNGRRPLTAEPWKEGSALEPGRYDRPARDRISILTDTDGDGVMDKKTVFHEGLELITGFCMHRDGVIAVGQPNIVFLQDTDGDDKADKETPLFGGHTPGDTHFVANHFIPAPDGWIYASTGTGFTATKPGTKEEMARLPGGIFRFKADGSAIQSVASSGGNSFGADVTSDMEIFLGKATTGRPLQHVVLPEWVIARAGRGSAPSVQNVDRGGRVKRPDLPDRAPLMQIDQVGSYSAACASLVYEGGAWPKEYDGAIFCTEPILDIIHCERLKPAGATFVGEPLPAESEWLRSRDYWFCPIDVTVGPDGAMYVLDFYTPVVAHSDSRGPVHGAAHASVRPDREHYFGRIYRIQHESAPKVTVPDLTKVGPVKVIEAFKHPSRTVRFNAFRVFMEQPPLQRTHMSWVVDGMANTPETFSPARILALWATHRTRSEMNETRKPSVQMFAQAAVADDASVRKNAFLIAEAGRIPLGEKETAAALNGTDIRVRLAALRALGASKVSEQNSALITAAEPKFDDAWSKAAAAAAVSASPATQLASLFSAQAKIGQNDDFARSLTASLVANADAEATLRALETAAKSPNVRLATVVLRELGNQPPTGPAYTAGVATLRPLLTSGDRALALAALPLAAAWDAAGTLKAETSRLTGELLATARDSAQPDEARANALRTVLAARAASPDILPATIALLGQPQPAAFRAELITALAATGEPAAGRALADAFPGLPLAVRDAAFGALVKRSVWATLLLDALEAKKFTPAVFGPAQISRLTAYPDAAIAKRATALFTALGSGTNPAKDEIIAKLRPVVETPGNAAKGRELFTTTCATCHRLAGAGFEFGPDLEGIGSHPAAELLMHIVDPNRMVDDEHRTWNFRMKDGTQYSALIATENAASVKLRQPGGATTELKVADIAERTKVATSLMPEGLEALGPEVLRDIITYIQSVAPKR